ncbi:hypothetical protein [Nocardioides caldifontis]|uniref:hypothetical protein n=1 Tax=Nocardioides caldifontis TaxID=2588938 RepID=UPI00193ABD15|nr:hypothetical protein [Nocardioides caldifontis]
MRHGGILRTRLVRPADLEALVRDAVESHARATEARVESSADLRGDPERWLESAPGGDAINRFATSEAVLERLRCATDVPWQPAGPGSWSYYRRSGHHLGLHQDLAVCDLAVITCVVDEGDSRDSGVLRLWPSRVRDDLDAIRRDPTGAVDIRLQAGETLVLLGGIVAHQLMPLAPDHVRIVAPLCYQVDPTRPE